MRTIHLKIYGIVQGVFFRQSTRTKALKLDINGWVRNCEDGTVEAEAQGEEERLKEFVRWCHDGPSGAQVTRVVINEIPEKSFKGFEITR